MRAHRSLALRWLLRASVPLALVGCVGCDASGSTEGGTPVQSDPCATGNLTPTWTTLYTCYFGPSGKAGCSGKTSCHGPPSPCSPPLDCLSGTTIWTCGPTRESCWQGMTTQQCFCPDASSPAGSFDAAIESGALDAAPESGPSDAASAETGTDGAATGACRARARPSLHRPFRRVARAIRPPRHSGSLCGAPPARSASTTCPGRRPAPRQATRSAPRTWISSPPGSARVPRITSGLARKRAR